MEKENFFNKSFFNSASRTLVLLTSGIPSLCQFGHLHIPHTNKLLQLFYTTTLLNFPRLRRHNFCSLIHCHDNARPAATGGFTGSCSLWMPLRPTTRLLGSNPSTLVQKDRPVGSCSGRFCRVLCACVSSWSRQAAWIRRGGDGRRQLHIGSPRTGPFHVSAGECS